MVYVPAWKIDHRVVTQLMTKHLQREISWTEVRRIDRERGIVTVLMEGTYKEGSDHKVLTARITVAGNLFKWVGN